MTHSQREFTGRHMAILLALFFGTIFAANMALVVAARESWTGLVVKNSYVASQHFNETTAELEKAAAMGIRHDLSYGAGAIRAVLSDSTGRAVGATNVLLKLGRPSFDGEDRELAMREQAEGGFAAETKLGNGVWMGEISAEIGGQRWRRPVRVVIGAN